MPKDPLALAIMAVPPPETEYDAVYATVMATERGRWFLTEYANRNRSADTGSVVAAMARIETAIRGHAVPQSSAHTSQLHASQLHASQLTEIAATIERLTATIAAETRPMAEIVAAAERIQDISFGLRARGINAGLCDGLDAAAGEICDACATGRANGEKVLGANALLHDLAARVDALIRLSPTGQAPSQIPSRISNRALQQVSNSNSGDDAAELSAMSSAVSSARSSAMAMELQEDKAFTDAVAALAVSLTEPEEELAATVDEEGELAADVMSSTGYAVETESPVQAPVRAPVQAPLDDSPRWHIEGPDFVFHAAEPEVKKDNGASPGETRPAHELLPEAELKRGPEDEPADSVGPVATDAAISPVVVPVIAPIVAPVVAASMAQKDVPPANAPSPQLRIANEPVTRVVPRPVSNDPLAAMRDLSSEELIALFT